MPIRLRYIITGTGRCGTGFMAKAFSAAGLPCGHERVFRGDRIRRRRSNLVLVADSSWYAVPLLNDAVAREAVVVHVVRHPLTVIASLMAAVYCGDESKECNRVLNRWLPGLASCHSPLERALHHYVHWNRWIQERTEGRTSFFHRVEEDINGLFKRLQEPRATTYSDCRYNTWRDRPATTYANLDWHDLPVCEDRRRLIELAQTWGYLTEQPAPAEGRALPPIPGTT